MSDSFVNKQKESEDNNSPNQSDILLFEKVKQSTNEDFEDRLLACKDDISRVQLFRECFQWMPDLRANEKISSLRKNTEYSTKLRNAANTHYKLKNFDQALHGYNLAIVYAPIPSLPILENVDTNLALAFGNRSAVWTNLDDFPSALRDIKLAVRYGYPVHLAQKLEERQAFCEARLTKLIKKSNSSTSLCEYKEENIFKIQNPNPLFPSAEDFVGIRADPLRGRHLIVNKNVSPGTVVIVEEPYVKVLQKELKWNLKRCHFCFKRISGGFPCSGCVFAIYCDETCALSASSSYHSLECPCMPYFQVSKTSAYTRMAFRIVCKIGPTELYRIFLTKDPNYLNPDSISENLGSDPHTNIYSSSSYLPIYHLISHANTLSPVENFTNTLKGIILAEVLCEFTNFYSQIPSVHLADFKNFMASIILRHLERVACNGISLSYQNEGNKERIEYGGAIYSLSSLLNHSCFPNTTRIHDKSNGKMSIITTMELKSGDEILTTYSKIFYNHGLKERQEYLQSNFNFKCNCEPCMEEWPLMDALKAQEINSPVPKLRCSASQCNGQQVLEENGICSKCGSRYEMLKLLGELKHQSQCFHEANQLISRDSKPLEAIRLLKSCLSFFQRSICQPYSTFVMAQDSLRQALDLIVKLSDDEYHN